MNRVQVPLSPIDVLAIVGLSLLALGVGLRFGVDLALALIGGALLLYAILASRSSEVSP